MVRRPQTVLVEAPRCSDRLEGCGVVEVATLGRPLLAGALAAAAAVGAFDLGGGELQAGADLVGVDLGDGALVAFGGLPGAGAQPSEHDRAVALAEGVGTGTRHGSRRVCVVAGGAGGDAVAAQPVAEAVGAQRPAGQAAGE